MLKQLCGSCPSTRTPGFADCFRFPVRRPRGREAAPCGPEVAPFGRGAARLGGWAAVLLFLADGTAWAIPSPDLILNLFASTAQLFALATVVLGTWFFGGSRRRRARGKSGKGYKIAFLASAGACAVCAVGWGLYAADQADQRNQRLEANLNRNSKEDGRKILDVSLKELSFSDQLTRADGMTTEELWQRIEQGGMPQFLDIRESEEFEMGRVRGARHVRFPDLMNEPGKFADAGQPLVLMCFNGNRSSELCEHLRPLGFDCSFVVGGAEKWVAEDRPLDMAENRSPSELRQIPDYPNKQVLLDTPDVMALLEERPDVLFVDVRYPGEFEAGHLPGAINIPMRKLGTSELEAALEALPKRPVIAPCYDKRSSFFAWTLGLRLSRRGYEFLGRYTVPESYVSPPKDKPHVAAWKAAHAKPTLMSLAAKPLEGVFGSLRGSIGSFGLAVIVLVAIVRLLLLPLTWKADRDRVVQQELEPKISALKQRHADDPASLSRATLKLLRAHGIRPVLNFASTLAQLLLFTLFFTVVDHAAHDESGSFLWLPALSAPDPAYVLPAAFGLLLGALILIAGRRFTRARSLGALAAAVGGALLVLELNGGAGLYLVANLGLLCVQGQASRIWVRRDRARDGAERIARRYAGASAVPLRFAHLVAATGNKAARLGKLIEAGLPVPDGFAVPAPAVEQRTREGAWPQESRRAIDRSHAGLAAARVAVRSSGLNEDGADKSYAGIFESLLDVERERLFAALDQVAASLSSARSQAYSAAATERGGIVVQAMVPAEFAGVLFTEHPGESGAALIELVAGLGEGLVSGRTAPQGFRLGRLSGRALDAVRPPIDLAPLFLLGREIESLFGRPQDIEWAYARGRFHILQARDITRRIGDGADARAACERERARLLEHVARVAGDPARRPAALDPATVVLAQNELSELLPRPTPFSLALMDSLWSHGGPTDLACRELGLPYEVEPDSPAYVVGVFGSLYVGKVEERRRLSRGPSALAAFRLARAADELERAFREDWLPEHRREARLRAALDLGRFETGELAALFRTGLDRFRTETYVQAETINLAADFYFKGAIRELERRGLDPAVHLGHPPATVVHRAFERLAAAGRGEGEVDDFLALFGHRAAQDYELALPRYAEEPGRVTDLALRMAQGMPAPAGTVSAPPVITRKVLALAVDRARRWQTLKEEAKHEALRDLALLREVVRELGRRVGLGDRVFQLVPEEIAAITPESSRAALSALARSREEADEAFAEIRLPHTLELGALEGLDVEAGGVVLVPRSGAEAARRTLRGTRVAGASVVSGRVRVLHRAEEVASFRPGEILVARFTDPSWMPVFPHARGIVTEIGGWLSHAAITAREYDVPAIVGVQGALESLADGDLVRLCADGTVERVDERRREPRTTIRTRVLVRRERGGSAELPAELADYSAHGAMLRLAGSLEIGEQLALGLEAGRGGADACRLEAKVVRNGTPGAYGLSFPSSLEPVLGLSLAREA